MSGRRRPRPRQPRTLRTRLVVASVVLIAVVCAVIGTVTTPAQFRADVTEGRIHCFIAGGGMGRGGLGGGTGTASRTTSRVEENFRKVTVGPATFYDLTRKTSD